MYLHLPHTPALSRAAGERSGKAKRRWRGGNPATQCPRRAQWYSRCATPAFDKATSPSPTPTALSRAPSPKPRAFTRSSQPVPPSHPPLKALSLFVMEQGRALSGHSLSLSLSPSPFSLSVLRCMLVTIFTLCISRSLLSLLLFFRRRVQRTGSTRTATRRPLPLSSLAALFLSARDADTQAKRQEKWRLFHSPPFSFSPSSPHTPSSTDCSPSPLPLPTLPTLTLTLTRPAMVCARHRPLLSFRYPSQTPMACTRPLSPVSMCASGRSLSLSYCTRLRRPGHRRTAAAPFANNARLRLVAMFTRAPWSPAYALAAPLSSP